jgi:SAM-dependent methyltransferase
MHIPWQGKVAVQFVLSHVPGGERLNYVLQRGAGSFSENAIGTRVATTAGFLAKNVDVTDRTIVEIGTGWNAVNPLMMSLFGARLIHTYDHVRHLRLDLAMTVLHRIQAMLDSIVTVSGIPRAVLQQRLDELMAAPDLATLLETARINYVAPGDATRTGLPDHSVDVVYSYAVLEHVSEDVIAALTEEARRVLVPGGVAVHSIGLHDHYVSFDPSISRVNFLQYPEWAWSLFVKNKISYHNRLREPQFRRIFEEHGARITKSEVFTDPKDLEALKRMKIDARFAGMSPDELAVTKMTVILSY